MLTYYPSVDLTRAATVLCRGALVAASWVVTTASCIRACLGDCNATVTLANETFAVAEVQHPTDGLDGFGAVHLFCCGGILVIMKVDVRLPEKRNSNSHGARPVY